MPQVQHTATVRPTPNPTQEPQSRPAAVRCSGFDCAEYSRDDARQFCGEAACMHEGTTAVDRRLVVLTAESMTAVASGELQGKTRSE